MLHPAPSGCIRYNFTSTQDAWVTVVNDKPALTVPFINCSNASVFVYTTLCVLCPAYPCGHLFPFVLSTKKLHTAWNFCPLKFPNSCLLQTKTLRMLVLCPPFGILCLYIFGQRWFLLTSGYQLETACLSTLSSWLLTAVNVCSHT